MYLGIDVGGTFTDGVLVSENKIIKTCKIPTSNNSILEAFEKLMDDKPFKRLEKIVISTTLMTNLILERKYDKTGLLLLPGPGISYQDYNFPFQFAIARGSIDFQGRIIEPVDEDEIIENVGQLIRAGCLNIGIISKFSSRNPALELEVEKIVKKQFPHLNIKLGHQVTGNLNFIRRAMGTGLFLATHNTFYNFILDIENSFKQRNINCPVYILKADGGIVPIKFVDKFAVDTILSGPAASCLGAKALLESDASAIVVDIGGTTTDLSLILNSIPLYASRGVRIEDIYTHVRSLAVYSIPIGGDTGIDIDGNNCLILTFQRAGLPACLGGEKPTLTDCLRVLDLTDIGDKDKAYSVLENISILLKKPVTEIANTALNMATDLIIKAIEKVFKIWQEEPAYRIWQLLNPLSIKPNTLICLGGPSGPMGRLLSEKMQIKNVHYPLCSVANAIGAALAIPTYEEKVRINTEKGEISSSWGYFVKMENLQKQKLFPKIAETKALEVFNLFLKENKVYAEPEIYQHEVFTMVRNWQTTGQIHEITLGIKPKILGFIENKECFG
jgi:N-methylhydantoinase A/oxoprolinase/acetone carboxylase beta subunit